MVCLKLFNFDCPFPCMDTSLLATTDCVLHFFRILSTMFLKKMLPPASLALLRSRDGHMHVQSNWLRGWFMVGYLSALYGSSWIWTSNLTFIIYDTDLLLYYFQLRVQKMVLNSPLWDLLTGLVLGWISYLELTVQVKVFLGFWHVLVMYVCSYLYLRRICCANLCCMVDVIKLFVLLQNLLRREPLKLVDGGESQRTFIYIKDAIEAVQLMIVSLTLFYFWSNILHMEIASKWCDNFFRKILLGPMVIFSTWATLTMKLQLGSLLKWWLMWEDYLWLCKFFCIIYFDYWLYWPNVLEDWMISSYWLQVYSKVSSEAPLEVPTIDVSSKEFYGVGYDDSDKRIPDMAIINKQLGITYFLPTLSFIIVSLDCRTNGMTES